MVSNDDKYLGIILEQIQDQNRAVLEAVTDLHSTVDNLPTRLEFTELQTEVRTMRAAIIDISQSILGLDGRIGRIEATIGLR